LRLWGKFQALAEGELDFGQGTVQEIVLALQECGVRLAEIEERWKVTKQSRFSLKDHSSQGDLYLRSQELEPDSEDVEFKRYQGGNYIIKKEPAKPWFTRTDSK
jgi:hypothetical protein